jgi:hypothetical protein
MDTKKLVNADDYREAWRLQDAKEGWIAYREDADYYCPPDVIGFDGDQFDGGVSGVSDTELRLVGFLSAIQPNRVKADLNDVYAYAKRKGLTVEGGSTDLPLDLTTKDMLDHEPYVLEDPKVGELWKRLRNKDRLQYAMLLYGLHRQKWGANWVRMTNRILLELDGHGLDVCRLRTLKRIDPLSIERARKYKRLAVLVPKRLRETLKLLEQIGSEESALPPAARAAVGRPLEEYRSFLDEYKQRRKRRFDMLAEHHFREIAGRFKVLLREPRGHPRIENLARRVAKAVFVELADEMIQTYKFSTIKATRLAGQITCLLFPTERVTGSTKPFERTYAKKALNEYKYAKKSLESV